MRPIELIDKALCREPLLTAFGLGIYREGRPDTMAEFIRSRDRLRSSEGFLGVALCVQWLQSGRSIEGRNSYGLKHEIENHFGVYICNGALIAAALGLGFEYEVAGPNVVLSD